MAGEKGNGESTKPGRRLDARAKRGRRPGDDSDRLEDAPPPRKASGDPTTLVGIDSPDDVDIYRHPGPPPGFTHAGLTRPSKRTPDKPSREDNLTER